MIKGLKFGLWIVISLLLSQLVSAYEMDGELTIDGNIRTYHLFIPDKLDTSKNYPLVIILHGGGGTGHQMIRFTKFDEYAIRDSFITAYPDGMNHHWNDERMGSDLPNQYDDVKFISTLIDELAAKHSIDPTKVFVTGISNGAIMSLFLAQEIPDKIRAIAAVCGSIPVNYASIYHIDRPISILIINGTSDPLVPYEGGTVGRSGEDRGAVVATDSMIKILQKNLSCKLEDSIEVFADIHSKDKCTVEKNIWYCKKDKELVLVKVNGGGHTWPGGFQYLPKAIIGKTCKDFLATAEIWNFFYYQYRLNKVVD